MLANNEVGTLQPVRELADLCHAHNISVHVDAVAAVGKVPVDVRALGCDTLAVSGHKLYAPKGVGFLFGSHTSPIARAMRAGGSASASCARACGDAVLTYPPLIFGCEQQCGMRGGTENAAGCAALGAAFAMLTLPGAVHPDAPAIAALVELLWERLCAAARGVGVALRRNGGAPALPNTLSVAFAGLDAADLQARLGVHGFSVAAGAAASNGRPSHVLEAMGAADLARSTLRFSLGSALVAALTAELPRVKRVVSVLASKM